MRRLFLIALTAIAALATMGVASSADRGYAPFTATQSISGSVSAGVWTGKITIIKDAIPNSTQGFAFTDDIPSCDIGTRIDNGTASSTMVCNNVVADGGAGTNYTVSETPASGWKLTNIVCSGDPQYQVGASGLFDSGDTGVTINLNRSEDVTCTFTNTKLSTLVVVKNTVGGNATFGYTGTGDGITSPFNITTVANTGSQTFSNLEPGGIRTIAESAPPSGWAFTSLSCSITTTGLGTSTWTVNGQSVDNLVLGAGDTVTCTYTNTKLATLVVVKNTVGGNNAFGFSGTGAGITSPFTINTAANTGSKTFADLAPGGSRSITESPAPGGWQFTSLSCSITTQGLNTSTWQISGQNANSIVLSAGDTVTCTYTNTKLGSIVIIKDAQPNDAQDFGFTATGGSPAISPSSFNLDDDADNTLSNTRTFDDVPAGTYTVTENVSPAGWTFTSVSCVDPTSNTTTSNASRNAVINVAPGETVTCTFVNTKLGTIVITKDAVPNDGQDFAFTASGGSPAISPSTFSLDDDADGTLSNTQTFNNVLPGSYVIGESALPSGWLFGTVTCNDPTTNTTTSNANRNATIDVDPGETVSCVFVNNRTTAQFVVQKDFTDKASSDTTNVTITLSCTSGSVVNDDNTASEADPANFTVNGFAAGATCTATEAVPAGYSANQAGCAAQAVTNGQTTTCTITNSPVGTGSITIIKDAIDAAGAHHTSTQDFAYTTSGTGLSDFSLDDDGTNVSNPPASLSNTKAFTSLSNGGVRTVTEGTITKWIVSSISCTGQVSSTVTFTGATVNPTTGFQSGDNAVNVTLANNEAVICTFVNVQLPSGEACDGFTQPNPVVVQVPAGGALFVGGNQDQIILGTSGNDNIVGGNSKDCILGLDGDDVLDGQNSPDALFGGNGNDTLKGGNGPDICDGGPGTDTQTDCETVTNVP